MKDYGEPVAIKEFEGDDFYSGWAIVDRDGEMIETFEEYSDFPEDHKEFIAHSMACVNSLSGVPDEWLKDRAAAKAMLLMHVLSTPNSQTQGAGRFALSGLRDPDLIHQSFDSAINELITQRTVHKREFDEITNALIDSFKTEG